MLLSKRLSPALLLAGGGGGANAFPTNSSTYINVHIPRNLYKSSSDGAWGYPQGYPHRRGRIGTASSHLPPQGSLSLNVYLADGDICSPPLDKAGYPKRPASDSATPFILMADRGNCTFTTKARNAQKSGAAAVIFSDTRCLCSDVRCAVSQATRQKEEPTVADDGSGSDVSIPTFLLQKPGAEEIKDTLRRDIPVLLDIQWHPPKKDGSINYAIWMDPLDNFSKDLLKEFKPIAAALGSKAEFLPRYMIHNGSQSHCNGDPSSDVGCREACTNDGWYCYPSTYPIPGAAVVVESLRRMCIWERHGRENDDGFFGRPWWDYVTYFDDRCSGSNDTFADPTCVNEAYEHAKVNAEYVKDCMADMDESSRLLDRAIKDRVTYGVYLAPTVHIDDQTLSWKMAANSPTMGMINTICDSFEAGHIPEVCMRCLGARDVVSCAASDGRRGDRRNHYAPKNTGNAFRSFFIFFVLAGAGVGVGFYAKKMRNARSDSNWDLRNAMLGNVDGGGAWI